MSRLSFFNFTFFFMNGCDVLDLPVKFLKHKSLENYKVFTKNSAPLIIQYS